MKYNFKEHVTKMLERMFNKFSWEKSQLLYEKTFWETELREAGFCKLLMNVSNVKNLYINLKTLSFYEIKFLYFLKKSHRCCAKLDASSI